MFALEITFEGDSGGAEVVFIRRPSALIGALESAHVVIDDMKSLRYHLRVSRELERRFRLAPIAEDGATQTPQFLDAVYDGETLVSLGPVSLRLTALDIDLLMKETEAPDKAGVRILREACGGGGPRFPALVISANPPMVVSFAPDQPILLGRARQCSLRVDVPSLSSKHARIGFESGEFWVEDLGSTNGTFVNRQQISGRVNVPAGVAMKFGADVDVVGVVSQDQLSKALSSPSERSAKASVVEAAFPVLVSLSESARPARIVLVPGSSFVLGRDPGSDMWLGAPHVSRRHCGVEMTKSGVVRIIDHSTNGTAYDGGILHKGDVVETTQTPYVLDFGGNISVAVCFDEKDEKTFIKANGSPHSFVAQLTDGGVVTPKTPVGPRARRTTTWLRQPTATGSVAADREGRFGSVRGMYSALSGQGRFVMMAVALGVAGILSLIVSLLIPVLR